MSNPLDSALHGNPLDQALNPLDSAMGQGETLITPNGPISSGKGAAAGYVAGIEDFGKNIAGLPGAALELATHPDELGSAISAGGEAAGSAVMHPFDTVKGILYDGIFKPVVVNNVRQLLDKSLTDEERFQLGRESSLAITGLAIGEGAGRVLGMMGKGAAAASKLKLLTGAKTVDEMVGVVANTLTPQEALQASALAQTAQRAGSLLKSAARTGSIGAGSGFAMGVAQSNTPEEAFKSGIINGMVGAFLGPVFHVVGRKENYQRIRDVAVENARDGMFSSIMRSAPDVAMEDVMKGVDFVNVASKHLPEGESHAFYDIPAESFNEKTLPENAIVRGKGDTRSVLIVGKDDAPPLQLSADDIAPTILKDQIAKFVQSKGFSSAALVGYDGGPGILKAKTVGEAVLSAQSWLNFDEAQSLKKLVAEFTPSYSTKQPLAGSDVPPTGLKQKFIEAAQKNMPDQAENIVIDMTQAKTVRELYENGSIYLTKDFINKTIDEFSYEKPSLDPSVVAHWKETGFVPNQLFVHKGVDHQFIDKAGSVARIRNLSDGKEAFVKFNDLKPASGRVTQVQYLKLEDATKQNPGSLSEAYGNAKIWLKDAFNKVKSGEKVDIENAPPIPIVRHQSSSPDALDFQSAVRKGTYFNIADAQGENWSYKKPKVEYSSIFNEGGEHTHYVLAKLKKPLMLFGNDANSGSAGDAVIKALKPEWSSMKNRQAAVDYLKPKLTPEEVAAQEAGGWQGYTFNDRLGQELARDAGYTEILNIHNPATPEEYGNEIVKLEPPDQYKFLEINRRNTLPIDAAYYSDEVKNPHLLESIKESPTELSTYQRNVDEIVKRQRDESYKLSESLATFNLFATRTQDGYLHVKDSTGRLVGEFQTFDELAKYAKEKADGGGIDLITGPPGVRNVGFDDNASFSLNKSRNFVNALRDWLALGAAQIATPYSYFTALEAKFGRKFFNDFFLPLQHAKSAYNVRMTQLSNIINPILARVGVLNEERKGHISNAIEAFSPEQMLGDKPSILPRALTAHEKRIGQELAEHSTKDDRITAYQFIRASKALEDAIQGGNKEEAQRLATDFANSYDLTDVQKTVVKYFREIKGEDIDDIALYAVNRLADGIEGKHVDRETYMNNNRFTREERQLVTDIEKVYGSLADEFGIDAGSRLGGYITHAVEYDGKVVDGSAITNSRYLPAKTRDFIYAAVRTGEMQNLIRDPGELLKKYITQGARTETLYPEMTKARNFLKVAYVGLDRGTAEAVNQKATSYMNQIIGAVDPRDALIGADTINAASGAFINMLQRVGINSDTGNKWLRRYFKVSELATQGFKPIAGLRDATSTLMYWYARFGTARLASFLSDWNIATDAKGLLQSLGTIPGLNVEFFTAIDGALHKQSLLDKSAEVGFKFSGQPYVYQQFHAMAYLNTVKTVLSAASDLEAKRISQGAFEKRIGLHTYDIPQAKQFTELLRQQPHEAAKYLADITGREVVGYYGMANHPFFMSSKIGKVIGQHGQWPLWMVQNFGRLASQGTKSQRLLTAAKVAGMTAAITYGGRAAGFNLGSWTFSPDNAIFLGGPLTQTGIWGAIYLGSNDPSQRDFAERMLQRQSFINFAAVEKMEPSNIFDSNAYSRSQYFLPMPSQVYNVLWGLARANNDDPLHIVGAQMLGIPIDQGQYPKPQ